MISSATPETPAIVSPAEACLRPCLSSEWEVITRAAYIATADVRDAAPQRIGEQHRDRHRADPARHRRDRRGDLTDRIEVDVADEAVVGAVRADVDHGRAGLDRSRRRSAAASRRRRRACRRASRPQRDRGCASGRSSRSRCASSSNAASGRPTRIERPRSTASAPSSSAPASASSSITPCGVHGTRRGRPWASRPAFVASARRRPCRRRSPRLRRPGRSASGSGS